MAMKNVNVDTSDLMQVERVPLHGGPPLDQPTKSPYYISQFPTTGVTSSDAIDNFRIPNIPSYRINPPQPLTLAGASSNATPTATASTFNTRQPPAPTISQALTTIPTGYQFAFNQVRLALGSSTAISTYKVYRATTSSNTAAQVIQTISHNPSNNGIPIVVQDAQPNGVTMFYWVSSVSTAGLESSLTAAQSGTVTSKAGFNNNSQLASTFNNNPANVNWSPGSTTTLSNTGFTTPIAVAADTVTFPAGQVSYNSGTAAIAGFGGSVIFLDDPTFSGGAVIYTTGSIQAQVSSDGRLLMGKIVTSTTGPSTGGGTSGGTTGISGAGGRGLIQ